jgi:Rhodopirellula transposase DDE domain
LYTLEELTTYDHDFGSFAEGVIIPHSFYDIRLNVGYIQLGTSHDTSEFACDSFRHWWYHYGRLHLGCLKVASSAQFSCPGFGPR